jgi:hypothetical protein
MICQASKRKYQKKKTYGAWLSTSGHLKNKRKLICFFRAASHGSLFYLMESDRSMTIMKISDLGHGIVETGRIFLLYKTK